MAISNILGETAWHLFNIPLPVINHVFFSCTGGVGTEQRHQDRHYTTSAPTRGGS